MSAPSPVAAPPRPSLPTDRFWKLDYAKLSLDHPAVPSPAPIFTIGAAAREQGVVIMTLAEARSAHGEILAQALGSSIADDETRFTALATSEAESGFFCRIPAGVHVDEPLKITIDAETWLGRGVIVVEAGASASFIEENRSKSLVCGIVELVVAEHARCTYTAVQDCGPTAHSFFTRRAVAARDALVSFASAELGAQTSQSYIDARLIEPGAAAEITTAAFLSHERYFDLGNDLDHTVGQTRSHTFVKAAAVDQARGRYYGNIRIAAHAHGADATLRDDTLLLSPEAHIDSVPALEIAANDVKAFHGATVGSVDAEQRFYAMSRGLSAVEAERMITLGFFEPAIARFPHEVVREYLRSELALRAGR